MRRMFDEKEIKELGAEGAVTEIAGGNIENAKPIYCHPIRATLVRTEGTTINFACLILDQSPNAFTYSEFIDELVRIFAINLSAVFPISGASYYASGESIFVNYYIDFYSNEIRVRGVRPDGTIGYFTLGAEETYSSVEFVDGVNKIN